MHFNTERKGVNLQQLPGKMRVELLPCRLGSECNVERVVETHVGCAVTCIPIEDLGVLRYSSALDTSTALSHVWTEVWLPKDACLLPAADSMAMVTALVLSRLSMEL